MAQQIFLKNFNFDFSAQIIFNWARFCWALCCAGERVLFMANIVRVLCRATCILAVVLGVIGAVLLFLPKYREMRYSEAQCRVLRENIEAKQQEIKDIRQQQQRLQTDPSFVEHIARENRRIRPNEIVFVYEVAP